MTEPKIEICVGDGKAICWSRHGVLWRKNADERLGSFSDSEVFDNDDRLIASFDDYRAFDQNGNVLGYVEQIAQGESSNILAAYNIFIDGKLVANGGRNKGASLAAIALLGAELRASS